ncbi:MAG: DHH family phosphoesterase, partial [Euryarchaeota archaeon]|nr:DHH family phosphoesterase [Euryarchaeota archaeon]
MNPPERVRDLRGFERAAGDLAQTLLASSEVSVIGHIDADGISAASIASNALRRGGVRHSVRFVKKLDEEEIARVNSHPSEAIWLVDLGSGSYSKLEHPQVCVADHHVPESPGTGRRKGRVDLFSFVERHLNPHLFGIDGSVEISSAGVAYMVARAMAKENVDLAPIAIVGAVGDFQDSAECRLRGMNREILDEASQLGAVSAVKDLRIFGRETRPVAKMLQYSTDPILPYLTNDAVACQRFLSDLGIPLTEGERWRCWVDLGKEERRTVASALSNHLLDCGAGHWAVRRLIGEVYVLSKEEKGTVLHDAKEFS